MPWALPRDGPRFTDPAPSRLGSRSSNESAAIEAEQRKNGKRGELIQTSPPLPHLSLTLLFSSSLQCNAAGGVSAAKYRKAAEGLADAGSTTSAGGGATTGVVAAATGAAAAAGETNKAAVEATETRTEEVYEVSGRQSWACRGGGMAEKTSGTGRQAGERDEVVGGRAEETSGMGRQMGKREKVGGRSGNGVKQAGKRGKRADRVYKGERAGRRTNESSGRAKEAGKRRREVAEEQAEATTAAAILE